MEHWILRRMCLFGVRFHRDASTHAALPHRASSNAGEVRKTGQHCRLHFQVEASHGVPSHLVCFIRAPLTTLAKEGAGVAKFTACSMFRAEQSGGSRIFHIAGSIYLYIKQHLCSNCTRCRWCFLHNLDDIFILQPMRHSSRHRGVFRAGAPHERMLEIECQSFVDSGQEKEGFRS